MILTAVYSRKIVSIGKLLLSINKYDLVSRGWFVNYVRNLRIYHTYAAKAIIIYTFFMVASEKGYYNFHLQRQVLHRAFLESS